MSYAQGRREMNKYRDELRFQFLFFGYCLTSAIHQPNNKKLVWDRYAAPQLKVRPYIARETVEVEIQLISSDDVVNRPIEFVVKQKFNGIVQTEETFKNMPKGGL